VLFNTLDFAVFITVIYCLFVFSPDGWKKYILLAASLFFYGYFDPRILALLVLTTAAVYGAAIGIERSVSARSRRFFLFLAVAGCLAFLSFFKYFDFFSQSLNRLSEISGLSIKSPVLHLILPAGISFYTFQLISYCVDVERRICPAEKSFPDLLLFVTYFPKLVAGPIERANRLLPLLKSPRQAMGEEMHSALWLIFWGIFKIVFFADNLTPIVNTALVPGASLPFPTVSFAAVLFAIQIYADFSGYTDTARGISRLFGIELVLNFNIPFLSSNPAEFWRRWHITVGAFFRDYIYIPLGGSRISIWRQNINIMIVWLLGGLWHGASVGFFVWGIYCGVCIIAYNLLRPFLESFSRRSVFADRMTLYGGRIFTFLLFSHGLLLFRVDSITHLRDISLQLLYTPGQSWIHASVILHALVFVLPLILVQTAQALSGHLEIFPALPRFFRYCAILTGTFLFFVLGSYHSDRFFYFQF